MLLTLIPFLILPSTFIMIECDEEKLHHLSLEEYRQFRPVSGPSEELERKIREKAFNELRTAILPYTPDVLVNDLISLNTLWPNITTPGYVRVKTSGECVARPVSGIFTDYHEYDIDIALVEVDWSHPIRCPFKRCQIALGFEFETKPRYLNNSVALVGTRSWNVATNASGRAVEEGIKGGVVNMSTAVLIEALSDMENDTGNVSIKDLDQNKTLLLGTVVAGITCRRIPYEILDVQPETKFNLFNIDVSRCEYVPDIIGCLTRCEHFIVAGMTPKGLARHAHRLCWWNFHQEKMFLVREDPLKLCDYDSKELTIPVREDGTLFSAHFWFEHSLNAT